MLQRIATWWSSNACGSALSATLTLVAPATSSQPTQTLTIPVTLGKGVAMYVGTGGGPAQRKVYVPVVAR